MKLNYQISGGAMETLDLAKNAVLIGRSSKCDLRVQDESISRHHCRIEVKEGQVLVTDLGSANGVYIDGKLIPANKPMPYPIFLTLTIGPHVAVSIENIDESSRANISKSLLFEANETSPGKKTRDPESKPAPLRRKKKDRGNALVYIAAFVIVAGGVWLFFESREPKATAPTQEAAPINEQSLQDNGNF